MAFKGIGEDKNGFTLYWKIKHFSLCSLKYGLIKSPIFRVEEMDNTEWNLLLYPDIESNVVLNIKRQSEDQGPENISVDIKLFLLTTNGDKVIEEAENASFELTYILYKSFQLNRKVIFKDEGLFLPDDTLTVGCFIKNHSKIESYSIECTAYSDIFTEKFLFSSPIDDFKQQQPITVSKASVSKKYPNFEIILEPSKSTYNKEFMTVKIAMAESSTDVLCKCKLSVEDSNRKVLFLYKGTHKFLANGWYQSWRLTNSASSPEKTSGLLKNSNLILHCVLLVSDGTYSSHIENLNYFVSAPQNKQPTKQSLKQKLKCLLEDHSLCDFTIHVDGKDFPIHKAVLGAVSPVFRAMFELEMKEKQNSVSIIKDIEANTMKNLIHFAYTESVEKLEWESAVELYVAADKYQILELKQCCANWIIGHLTVNNVTEVLTISDMHQDNNLEKAAVDFVFAHAKEVFRSENWKMFIGSNAVIAVKIMQKICNKFISTHNSSDS